MCGGRVDEEVARPHPSQTRSTGRDATIARTIVGSAGCRLSVAGVVSEDCHRGSTFSSPCMLRLHCYEGPHQSPSPQLKAATHTSRPPERACLCSDNETFRTTRFSSVQLHLIAGPPNETLATRSGAGPDYRPLRSDFVAQVIIPAHQPTPSPIQPPSFRKTLWLALPHWD